MSAITSLWRNNPAFRLAAQRLLSLNSDQIESLKAITSAGFAVEPGVADQFGLTATDFELMALALRTIYWTARREEGGQNATIEELQGLHALNKDVLEEPSWEGLTSLLDPRPEVDADDRYESIQRSVFPVLEEASFTLDLRVPNDPEDDELVPVVLARFAFDEPPQAGESISFQLTDASLDALESDLARIRELREKVLKVIGRKMGGAKSN